MHTTAYTSGYYFRTDETEREMREGKKEERRRRKGQDDKTVRMINVSVHV